MKNKEQLKDFFALFCTLLSITIAIYLYYIK